MVTFVKTNTFKRKIRKILKHSELEGLQIELNKNPEAGDLIPKAFGLRKIRCAIRGRGKRGGARVIYYYYVKRTMIVFLDAYAKNDKENIKNKELRKLSKLIKTIEGNLDG